MSKICYPLFHRIAGTLALAAALITGQAIAQPTISSVSPGVGIGGSTSVTITGTNFNTTAGKNYVWFGATKASVTSATSTSLAVTVPSGALYAPISVLDTTTRLTGYQQHQFLPSFDTSCTGTHLPTSQVNYRSYFELTTSANPASIAIADIDGDGKPDIVAAERTSTNKVIVYRNISSSGVISASSFVSAGEFTTSAGALNVKAVDLDGDGKPELIVSNPNSTGFDVLRNTSSSGSISFAAKHPYTCGVGPFETAIADFDGDGRPDIAIVCFYVDSVCVFRNLMTAPGSFTAASFAGRVDFQTGHNPKSVCAADIDGDGKPDLVVSNNGTTANSISVIRNSTTAPGPFSSSSFATKVDFSADANTEEVQAGDLDGDGKPEIILADSAANGVSVFYNTSTSGSITSSSLAAKVNFPTSGRPYALSLGDVNGDGKLDIIASNTLAGFGYGSSVSILRNITTGTGPISTSSFATYSDFNIGGTSPVGIVCADLNGDNMPEVIVADMNSSVLSVLQNYPLPYVDTIAGPTGVCASGTANYTNTVTGGIWAVTNHTGSVISTGGMLTAGSTSGLDTVSYTIVCHGDTAIVRKPVSINSLPAVGAITGPTTVCAGDSIQLADTTSGGTWSDPTTTSYAGISSTGYVHGLAAGTASITYTVTTGCGSFSAYYTVIVNALPALISGPSSVCVGSNITLSDGGSGTWGVISGPATVSSGVVHGTSAGSAVISYAYGTGCYVTDTIAVNSAPASITGTGTLCSGVSLTLMDATTPGTWHTSSSSIANVDSMTGVVTGGINGTATISYGVTGSGCFATTSVVVAAAGPPVASITTTPAVGAICSGVPVTFHSNVVNGGATPTFQWQINGINSGSDSMLTYVPNNGDHVSLILVSSSPCASPTIATAIVTVPVTPAVTPSVTIYSFSGSDTVCSGGTITLAGTTLHAGTAPQFQWWVNNVLVGFGSVFTYSPADGDTVNVHMESNAACASVDTVLDTFSVRVVPFAAPTASMVGSDTICQGYPAVFFANNTYAGSHPLYIWTVNGINTSTLDPLSYMPSTGDVVQLTMTSNYPCLSTPVAVSTPETLTVIPVFVPTVTVTPVYPWLLPGALDYFTTTVVNPGSNPHYQWYLGNTAISGATTSTLSYYIYGRDSISCQVENTDLCNGIIALGYVVVDTTSNLSVSSLNLPGSYVHVAPNPNNGDFSLTCDLGLLADEDVVVQIDNMLSQQVYTNTLHASAGKIDERISLGDLPPGMYLLTARSPHLQMVQRIEIQK